MSSSNSVRAQKRLQKELQSIVKDPIPGVRLDSTQIETNMFHWEVEIDGAAGTLYQNEKFLLQFKFSSDYPFDSPQVVFIGANIPIHPHIYSNGHICLSILTEDWSPALSVRAICLSIVSMLSSCKEKKSPPNNSTYIRLAGLNPKATRWEYHDENV